MAPDSRHRRGLLRGTRCPALSLLLALALALALGWPSPGSAVKSPPPRRPPPRRPPPRSPAPPSPPPPPSFQTGDGATLMQAAKQWGVQNNWSPDLDCVDWDWIYCDDSDTFVVDLRVPQQTKLNGPIPTVLGNLAFLTALDLSFCNLTGQIPVQLFGATSLQTLYLKNNQLQGIIPADIANLTALVDLQIYDNNLVGSLPASLGSLVNLQTLLAFDLQLSGTIPSELGNLVSIQDLEVYSTALTGSIPDSFSKLAKLNKLDLSYSGLSGNLSTGLGNLVALQYLKLSGGYFTGPIPDSFSGLTSITSLYLDRNQLSGAIPPSLSTMAKLKNLVVYVNQLSGDIPAELGSLTGLTSLDLSYNVLTGTIPSTFSRLKSLQILHIHGNSLTGYIPSFLAGNAGLQELQLEYNSFYGGIPSVILQLKKLTLLHVQGNQLSGLFPVSSTFPVLFSSTADVDFHDNFFTGFSSSASRVRFDPGALDDNCFTPTSPNAGSLPLNFDSSKDPVYGCQAFCNASSPLGTCAGRGSCYLANGTVPTCDCNPGFIPRPADTTNPATCIQLSRIPPSPPPPPKPKPSPPPPPGAPTGRPTGINPGLVYIPMRFYNRWSRYLTRGYKFNAGKPNYVIDTLSAAAAPDSQFPPGRSFPSFIWTTVRDQGTCNSCWATTATDALASASLLASTPLSLAENGFPGALYLTYPIPDLSVDQMTSCSVNGSCATGGVPSDAFDTAVRLGSVLSQSFTPTTRCSSLQASTSPYKAVMYESVQFRGWFGLLLAVHAQPVVVMLESGTGFRDWNPSSPYDVYQDPNCYSGNIDHAVLFVGYQLVANVPYWVVRNSWGTSWGDQGYMKMAITAFSASGPSAADPRGVCGVYVFPALYPVAPPLASDPCYSSSVLTSAGYTMNPCGQGKCTPCSRGNSSCKSWGKYSYTCDCSLLVGYIAVNNTVSLSLTLPDAGLGVTQTCVPQDVCGTAPSNPCSVGTCVNDNKGGYSCICPLGYYDFQSPDGSHACVLSDSSTTTTYTVTQPGMTCYLIYVTFQLSKELFLSQNPGISSLCNSLPVGRVVNVANPNSPGCITPYSVSSGDSCASIAALFSIDVDTLRSYSPGLDCNNIVPRMQLCVQPGPPEPATPCLTQVQATGKEANCTFLINRYFKQANAALAFFTLNPGLNCDTLATSATLQGSQAATAVCVAAVVGAAAPCKGYKTKPVDTCATVVATQKKVFKTLPVTQKANPGKCQTLKKPSVLICYPK